ncbi:flavin reductase family protein [Inmirania thermothiophila]|uniref:Flavin reductase (DIM6/NTAB) family NADH-FMN oxidoreductase RutF n=1 Tax=Inmirania thermothiophila TaxID=1750597 RepID=A0A3N1Y9X1_9GAMM|nr:flavin reductase family protein [Inmirania thermothiophila]ROR34422.1 flavin reductase (DIM6/NTAB) family NADH-FMN oxidoreductase RutF [Inmirania thermothiophila]
MYVDLDALAPDQVYFTLTQTVIPRPIAWVLTGNADGSLNLAPFSYFNAVASDPPLVMLSIGRKPTDGGPKDTCRNIAERGRFVIHIAHRELLDALNESSATLPYGESELERLGLALEPFEGFDLPRLAACRIAMACERFAIHEIGAAPQALILGRVRRIWYDDAVAEHDPRGRLVVHAERVDPIARLGASEYVTFGAIERRRRPR